MPAVTELGENLARALGSGEAGRLRDRYAPDATLEAHLPGGSPRAVGRPAVLEALERISPRGARVRVLEERPSRGGSVLRLESRRGGRVERRRHLLHLRRGRIGWHVVYPERPPPDPLPTLPAGVGRLARRIVDRSALEPGISGCQVERWRMDDGRTLFAKHLRPSDSWLMRATGDRGREAELLVSGALDAVGEVVDHAVLDAVRERGGWLLLSEDRSGALARAPSGPRARRRLLNAIGEVHRRFRGRSVAGTCGLVDRLGSFSPRTAERELDGTDLAPKVIGRGWELFRGIAAPEVVAGVDALLVRPDPLVRALHELPSTLVHGDLRPGNVGTPAGRPVVLDWGLALDAPPAFEAAWWLFNAGWRSAAALSRLLDEALGAMGVTDGADLGLLATLAQAAPYFGFEAVQSPDPAARRRALDGLRWWSSRAVGALDSLSP
ncbi:MAG TPA: phosphotransferase [Actinomycetota bacterium]